MQKNILIGNGINIQFGGEAYLNQQIMKRVIANITSNKYERLFPALSSTELISLFEGLHDIVVNIDKKKPFEDFLFLQMEKKRIKDTYSSATRIEDIALEDYFIALEFLWEETDTDEFRNLVHRGLQQIFLDAIYNEGKIQKINYGAGMERFLSRYDNIFTINYDSNIERYTSKPVIHLHGSFNTLAPNYDINSSYSKDNPDKCLASQVVRGFEHTFSNTIMSWYWLEKYGEWLKDESYGKNILENIEGKLDIIGVSPNNDYQLFITIDNSKINNLTYYYKTENDRTLLQRNIKKNVTFASVDKLWTKI